MNDIAKYTDGFSIELGIPECTICIVAFSCQSKGDIVVARGEVERVLVVVFQDVETGLAEVGVFGGVHGGVVVVPECSGCLGVGVVVVFVFTDSGSIVGPTIKRGTTWRRCVSVLQLPKGRKTYCMTHEGEPNSHDRHD
jgi:hypothetical protein